MTTGKLVSGFLLVWLGALGAPGCKVGSKTELTTPGGGSGGGVPLVTGAQPGEGGGGGAPRSGPPTGAQAGARAADDEFTGPLSIEGLSHVQIWDLLVAKGVRRGVIFKITGEVDDPPAMHLSQGPKGLNMSLPAYVSIDGPVSDATTVMPQLAGLPAREAIEKLVAAGIIEFEIETVQGCAAGIVCATGRPAGVEGKYYVGGTIQVGR